MERKVDASLSISQLICGAADELRDGWLARQSESDFQEIMALSISQHRMMRAVWRMTLDRPDGVMLKALAEKLSLSSSAVSVMVDAMVRRGFFERTPSASDRRKVMIRISDDGWRRTRIYETFFQNICREFSDEQDAEQMAVFLMVLEKFIAFLRKKNEDLKK